MNNMKLVELYKVEVKATIVPKCCNYINIVHHTPTTTAILVDSPDSHIGSLHYTKENIPVYRYHDKCGQESWIAVENKLEQFLYQKYKNHLNDIVGELHHSRTEIKLIKHDLFLTRDMLQNVQNRLKSTNEWRNRNIFYRIFYSIFKTNL